MIAHSSVMAAVAMLLAAAALAAGSIPVALVLVAAGLAASVAATVDNRRRARAMRALEILEENLRASEQKFAGILTIAADAIITVDDRQNIVHFNWGAEQIFGHSEADVLGRSLDMLLPGRFRSTHSAYVEGFARAPETARRMGHRRKIYGLRKSGEEFPAEASISKLVTRGHVLFTVVLRDITDRKRGEEQQRYLAHASAMLGGALEMEETLSSVVEVARPMLADACVLFVNGEGSERALLTSGHDEDASDAALREVQDNPQRYDGIFRVMSPLPRADAVLLLDDRTPSTRAPIEPERRLLDAIGGRSVVVVPLLAGERELGRLLLITTGRRHFEAADLPLATELGIRCSAAIERARLYDAARRATRAREEVLAVVSHDLRNPISAIAMCARVLTESPPESESERRRTLGAITEATDWANRLIEDLLDMASIEAGTLSIERTHETVPLLVQSAVGILEGQIRERGHEVIVNVAHGISSLHADAGRIVQVLSNLLGNAVKFTPPGGRITIHVDAADGQTRFRVSDTGPGIPPEEATLVFQRYWHVRRGAGKRGSGLGLAIARGIVDAHGGRIWLESEPGKGASFIFTIPDEVPLQ